MLRLFRGTGTFNLDFCSLHSLIYYGPRIAFPAAVWAAYGRPSFLYLGCHKFRQGLQENHSPPSSVLQSQWLLLKLAWIWITTLVFYVYSYVNQLRPREPFFRYSFCQFYHSHKFESVIYGYNLFHVKTDPPSPLLYGVLTSLIILSFVYVLGWTYYYKKKLIIVTDEGLVDIFHQILR